MTSCACSRVICSAGTVIGLDGEETGEIVVVVLSDSAIENWYERRAGIPVQQNNKSVVCRLADLR
jgi:hypothetical protein